MKIGMLVHDLAVSGGYQKLVLRLSEQLQKKGHEVKLYAVNLDRKNCYPELIKNFSITTLGPKEHSANGFRAQRFPPPYSLIINKFKKMADKIDKDLDALILHDEVSLFALNYYSPRSSKTKIIWMLNNQLRSDLTREAIDYKKYIRKNVVRGLTGALGELKRNNLNSLYRAVLDKVDHFAVYDTANKILVKKVIGREADLVYAGADLEQFAKLRRNKIRQTKAFKVLSVGVAFPHRRYEDLIDATAKLVIESIPVEVMIVGRRDLDKNYSTKLEAKIKKLRLDDRISLVDYVPDDEMKSLYREADAFVFINDAETWGISVFEAIAAGIPTVITSNIGAADIVRSGTDGWIVPPRKPREVAKALTEIYKNPQEARDKVTSAAERITSIVSWEAYANRMMNLILSEGRTTGEVISKAEIARFLPAFPVIVEAGAHTGVDTEEMARLWPEAKIHAFEPVPAIYKQLVKRVNKYRNVHTYQLALSDKSGAQKIFVSGGRSDGSSSLLKPKEHLRVHPDVTFDKTLDIKAITLSDWVTKNKIPKINFLWLDMQGLELIVMKASEKIVKNVDAIYTEASLIETYEKAATYKEIRSWLNKAGFKPIIEKFSWEDMGNVLFIRK